MKPLIKVLLNLFQLIALVTISETAVAQIVKADFSATPTVGCPPMVVNFRDASTGNPTSWLWDLGNGTQSTLQHPTAAYFNPGTYNVKLIVRNATSTDTIIKSQYIVINAAPSVNFTSSDTTGCYPLKVKFTDASNAGSGNISSWQWDFGDGTLSTEQNPVHTYTNSGVFTVTLRVMNSKGCVGVYTRPSYITITDGVKANFTFSSAAGCLPPTPVTFSNTTTGSGTLTYNWSFGDGNTSTLTDPVNSYTKAGSYTIRLIAKNSIGCADTLTRADAVNIGFVKADFSAPAQACAGAQVSITNTSTPNTVSSLWYFGDGTTSNDINPTKSYKTAGTYKIKLVNDFGSCKDSIEKSITILDKPKASFTASNTTGCSVPLKVDFQNTSTNGVSYQWLFGDGGTSTNANPSYTYTVAGSYNVTLIATGSNGCTDTIISSQLIKITLPRIVTVNNIPVKTCLPVTVTPVAVIQSAEPITSYFWDFGDGSTSTQKDPSHTYTTPGFYNVSLKIVTASGCADSLQMAQGVTVGNKPATDFMVDPAVACADVPIVFTDLTTNVKVHEWEWDFGDGTTSTMQTPNHDYRDTGRFDVRLIVTSFGCRDTLKKQNFVYIKPPIADFDTAYYCNDRLTRRFIDRSKGATQWRWNFGDGTPFSYEPNPTHTYAKPGVYDVELEVYNENCRHMVRRPIVVVKENGNLTISDSAFCRNTRITMDAANVNRANIKTYTWYFQGLNGSPVVTNNSPVAQSYQLAGTYNVAVVTSDILGCRDTMNAVYPLSIYGTKAQIQAPVPPTCYGMPVMFTSLSVTDQKHSIAKYFWDFGDGNKDTVTSSPVLHKFDTSGTFNIKLGVIDTYGCKDSVSIPALVTITNPKAKFSVSDTLLCPNSSITITDNSTGGLNVKYLWSLGNGQTSTSPGNFNYTYATPGNFKLQLNLKDTVGCTDSMSVNIKVFPSAADFNMSDSFSSCPPLLVDFKNQSTNFTGYSWDFGDGGNSNILNPSHSYIYPGSYTVKLWVNNKKGGCSDTLRRTVKIQGPSGVFSYTPLVICNPDDIQFKANTQNTVKYIWDYDDGNITVNDTAVSSHRYLVPGKYLPKMILEDAMGCKVPIVGTDTLKVNTIKTSILSQARIVCDSGFVAFSDSTYTNDAIGTFNWDFGDGTTSTQRSPTHNYNQPGLYTIKMIATSAFGCKDSATSTNLIKVSRKPAIAIGGSMEACEPAALKFTGDTLRADTAKITWSWDFGNGDTSMRRNPLTQTFSKPGSYSIKATAVNSDNCSTSIQQTITIHPIPVIDAGPDTVMCRYKPIMLQPSGGDTYTWDANPTLSCTNCATPLANADTLMKYKVTGRSAFGCASSDSVIVRVKQPIEMMVSRRDTICVGESVTLKAAGAEVYEWSPALFLDNPFASMPKSTATNTITYTVVGADDRNCFHDTGFVTVNVYQIPRIEINGSDARTINVGASTPLSTTSSADIVRWKWQPSAGLDCVTCPNPTAAPKQTTTYSVIASNDGDCVARDEVTITVICNNTTIYIPNTFSPNADGMNDHFYPRSSGLLTVRAFRIYNRWGQIVFQRNNFIANTAIDGWDGTMNGVKLSPDVYVYSLEVTCENGATFPIKGNVTLIK